MVSAAGDTIVVAYESASYPPMSTSADTVWLGSLELLEVRLQPMNTWVGLVRGAVIGAIVGTVVVVGFARTGNEYYYIFPASWRFGASLGAILGGGFGAAFAHDRGTRWKRVALPHVEGAEALPHGFRE